MADSATRQPEVRGDRRPVNLHVYAAYIIILLRIISAQHLYVKFACKSLKCNYASCILCGTATVCIQSLRTSITYTVRGRYLDELSFDRGTMMRMRKAVDQHRSGCLFDLHSCNKYHCGVPSAPHACSALIYMAHFAFLDSIWFGEGFSPNYPPDQVRLSTSRICSSCVAAACLH